MKVMVEKNYSYILILLVLNLISCSTISNRSKPPPLEHFSANYEKINKDLIRANSFAFIYKEDKYYFNLAKTYIKQGPQLYYLGYKNDNLHYVIRAQDIFLLNDIFKSKDKLYKKTQKIIVKLNGLNLYPTKSDVHQAQPKNSILYDLTLDTMDFVVWGSIAAIGFPWMVGGYGDYLSEKRDNKKLDAIRLGMAHEEVDEQLSKPLSRKVIDQYEVEVYSLNQNNRSMNALLIFENNKLVGMVRNLTNEPITDFYEKL